eukprot:7391267-Prymnesium_polylepis.1
MAGRLSLGGVRLPLRRLRGLHFRFDARDGPDPVRGGVGERVKNLCSSRVEVWLAAELNSLNPFPFLVLAEY